MKIKKLENISPEQLEKIRKSIGEALIWLRTEKTQKTVPAWVPSFYAIMIAARLK